MLSFFTGTFSQFLQNFWQNFPRAIENAAAGYLWPAGPGLDHPELNPRFYAQTTMLVNYIDFVTIVRIVFDSCCRAKVQYKAKR